VTAVVLGCAAVVLILGGVIAIAWSILAGHRLSCLPRVIAYRVAWAVLRVRWAWRCRGKPVPDDGEKLTRAEAQVLGDLDAGRDVRSRT
jgi:hypothetical protein